MAGLEALTSMIYFEKQQPGSMLCAQHSLNNLLQGNYFSAPDLATIATSMDNLEHESFGANGEAPPSTNMDDTGFFSIQVMEQALSVWGLTLVRWRSEDMKEYNSTPQIMLGFILNLDQHWFTLRRFGPAQPDLKFEEGKGHWYNLDSRLKTPQWVSRLYLGMVIGHAEEEGYSVFAVCQIDPLAEIALPRTEADVIAETLTVSEGLPTAGPSTASASGTAPDQPGADVDIDAMDDEDLDFQAALQASIIGNYGSYGEASVPLAPPAPPRAPVRGPMAVPFEPLVEPPDEGGMDLVAEGMARNRALMARMVREQEMALQETYEDEMTRFGEQTRQRQLEADREEAEVQRAIAESQQERDQDEDEEEEEEDEEEPGPVVPGPVAGRSLRHVVYDDEDAELQAALKASLETVPEGFVIPQTPPPRRLEAPPITASSSSSSADVVPEPSEEHDVQTETEDEGDQPPSPIMDMEEIRRRRLARFG